MDTTTGQFHGWKLLREPFLAGSHLLGALAAIVGAVLLLSHCGSNVERLVAAGIYSVTLILLFLASGLMHGAHCSPKTEALLVKLDYVSIYLFIAGTYTPVCLFIVDGQKGIYLLIFQWLMAVTGVVCTMWRGFASKPIQVAMFLGMGWMFLLVINTIARNLAVNDLLLLIGGGLTYSTGAAIFAFCPGSFLGRRVNSHAVWHILVLVASTFHHFLIRSILISS